MLKKMEVAEVEMVLGGGDIAADCGIAVGAAMVVAGSEGTLLLVGGGLVAAGSAKLCYNDLKELPPTPPRTTSYVYNPDPQSPNVNWAMRENGIVAQQDVGSSAAYNVKPGSAY
ncbi:hypothetical protein [Deinococcus sp.]|uniref:hypothetical protein n=1 Tax=Deinococcus sp. TaxID=47478 RepID=UPI0025F8703A|nr:hypothetical protein [Deinococcus sp.]